MEFEGRLFSDVGVRYKGNGTFLESRDSLKRSLKIELNKYAKGQRLGDVRMLTLQNNVTDASLMNEVLAYRLYRDAGVPAPRTAYARVFVTVPGKFERKYIGLYSMTEAVDKQFAQRDTSGPNEARSSSRLPPPCSRISARIGPPITRLMIRKLPCMMSRRRR